MRYLTLSLLMFLPALCQAQSGPTPEDFPRAIDRVGKFRYYEGRDADSALYFAQALSSQRFYAHSLLEDELQGSFARSFLARLPGTPDRLPGMPDRSPEMRERRRLLRLLAEGDDAFLSSTTAPLYLWATALHDSTQLARVARTFLETGLRSGDLQTGHVLLYALLTWQISSRTPALSHLSDLLMDRILLKLSRFAAISRAAQGHRSDGRKLPQINPTVTQWQRRVSEDRYLYSCAAYFRAQQYLQAGRLSESKKYFRIAFDYSPDNTGIIDRGVYVADVLLLFGKEKFSFREDYLSFLSAPRGSLSIEHLRRETLSCLLDMVLLDPSTMPRLKAYYTLHFSQSKPFAQYWREALDKQLRIAPPISLSSFSLDSCKGRWVLIDFWGTWCTPCRAELPEIQKFYETVVLPHPEKWSMIGIACKDSDTSVNSFMKQNAYTFPVALSDNHVESRYPVSGYPTKILITPQGRFQVIPIGSNWVDFVSSYYMAESL
jgi:hypothetical protein